ncbi:hypothetical protein ACROYT_G007796 [Oculina patagonica]
MDMILIQKRRHIKKGEEESRIINKMTLLVKATVFLCLAVMLHIDSDVNAYLIRNIHQCFEVCENRYWDCLVFCDMSSVRLCERRCEGMFYDCTADCPILSR